MKNWNNRYNPTYILSKGSTMTENKKKIFGLSLDNKGDVFEDSDESELNNILYTFVFDEKTTEVKRVFNHPTSSNP